MGYLRTIGLLLLLTGCQSGLSDGALNSSFPPAGWQTTVSEGRTQYLCNPPACTSTELVLVDDIKGIGLSENLIRNGTVGSDVVAKVDAYISRARKGTYKAVTPIPVATDSYAGFRHKATLKEDGGLIFLAGQSIVQGNGGVLVMSFAHDEPAAERNLDAYLAATKIQRVQ